MATLTPARRDVRRPPRYLELAQDLGLGVADRRLIRLETIDLPPYIGPFALALPQGDTP